MNAFMIFARRRRPQVSAANQMMRTGEISKILSKEWNTMPLSEKQFYLDQAKKLKENFNSKYPDYVYRRRPNNSRKKRRNDAAPYDLHDFEDFDSVSPVEPHPHQHSLAHGGGYPRLPFPSFTAEPSSYYPSRHPSYDTPVNPAAAYGPTSTSLYHDDDPHFTGSLWPHAPLPSSTKFLDGPSAFPSKLDGFPTAKMDMYPRLGGTSWNQHPHHNHQSHHGHHASSLSSRRGTMHPAPLPLSHHTGHTRHWSDSTTSASSVSPPSSAGSGAFPASVTGATATAGYSTTTSASNNSSATNNFATLTAPFYPQTTANSGTNAGSPASIASNSPGATGAAYYSSAAETQRSTYANGTLALSPQGLQWPGSSIRTKAEL
ncbi:hypothetical protein M422DRAFT_276978 [Sphaerobolus stellatus SS14]|uniref:HMG box domain-containing protein n=1 Tax=Sphaerobolus stellatus (strain SS14) TaxID=990650 RepID=A0A0C9TL26_SPHS4|nr:hypothetical protein M422DRAFT_276978 [Sphaerobolus stellatus SS14]